MHFCTFLCVKDNIFMRNKNVLEEESHLFTFCTFHAFCTFCGYKKHLSESRLFTFCTFCAFCAFCAYKKHLSESCLFAFCTFYAFCTFCVCEIFSWKKNKTAIIPSFILLLFLIKLQAWGPGTLSKRDTNTGDFLWTPFLKNICEQLLLKDFAF